MTEKIMSGFFLVISSLYLFFASDLSFGKLSAPKAGFLPILAGVCACFISLAIIIKSILSNKTQSMPSFNARKLIFATIGLICYLVILSVAGYFFATFIAMLYLFKVTETDGWIRPFMISIGISAGFYLIFKQYLGIYLP